MSRSLTLIFFILILFLDDNILTLIGYPHKDITAAQIFKVHPLAYLSVAVLLFFLLIGKIKVKKLWAECRTELLIILICLILLAYIFIMDRFNSMASIVDALISPAIVSILFHYTPSATIQRFEKLIYIAFFINFALALVEKLSHKPILSTEYLKIFSEFRSTALYGHPLNNAIIMSTIGLFLFLSTENFIYKLSILFCTIISILCFGARGAIIGIVGSVGISFIIDIFTKSIKYNVKNITVLILIAIASSLVLINTKLGDRVLQRASFTNDDSAYERVKTLHLLDLMTDDQFQWGTGDNQVAILMHQAKISIMENFIVVWITRFGIYLSLILLFILVIFLIKQIRYFNKLALLPVLFTFLFIASINNSLASKTHALSILTLCCYSLRKNSMLIITKSTL
jgi:hypothetical protein